MLAFAFIRESFDHDTAGEDALRRRAMARMPNASDALRWASFLATKRGNFDSAYALARRAATVDPRSIDRLYEVGERALSLRRWTEAQGYANAILALDSADERGWMLRIGVPDLRGDALGMQREVARTLARVPHPSGWLLAEMAYAGGEYGGRYLALSTREFGAFTLPDSVYYYDTKADISLYQRDPVRVRVYADSVRRLLAGRALSGFRESGLLAVLAFAHATLGDTAAARRTLTQAIALARATDAQADSLTVLDLGTVAGTYARLGDTETAVRWIEARFTPGRPSMTAQFIRREPKLLVLQGTPAFERLLRAQPE